MEWFPIETAPFDKDVLLYTVEGVRVGRADSEDGENAYYPGGKQWSVHDGKHCHELRGAYPTHWMEVPAVPASTP